MPRLPCPHRCGQAAPTGVTFYARLAWGREFHSYSYPPIATDNLGAYFSTQPVLQDPTNPQLLAQPQVSSPPGVVFADTLNYTRVSGTFVAQGDERYLTLGNFRPDAQTTTRQLWTNSRWGGSARYALDDVSVEAVPPAGLALGPDRWLGACAGAAPVTLTAPAGFQSYRWRTGQTTASIQVSQPGRYVVTADFGCGLVKDSVEVHRYDPQLTPLLVQPPALCPGQSLTLTAAAGFQDYRWADGPTGPARTPTQPGPYRLTARTADGCLVRDSVELVALPPPVVPTGFPADTAVCMQEPWRFTLPPPPAGVSYEWSTDALGSTLLVPAGAAGPYTLTIHTRCQIATATVRVRTQDCAPLLQVPNIVTPNHDGRNDRFRVTAPSPRPLRLQVFTRWGQLVFESADYRDQWPTDSPAVPAGIYYYLLVDSTFGRRYRGWVEMMP